MRELRKILRAHRRLAELCLLALLTELGARGADEFSIRVWQIQDGLPQSSVTSIAQSPDGYLWLATFNGLARFDGERFTIFDEGNTPALLSSRLVRVDTDAEGNLWIITEEGGLCRYRAGRFTTFGSEQGLPAGGAAAVTAAPHGGLLLVARAGGIYRLKGNSWRVDPRFESLRGTRISVWSDEEGVLWVWLRDKRKLGRWVNGELTLLRGPGGAEDANVRAYAPCRAGGLWIVLSTNVWRLDCQRQAWSPTLWTLPESAHGLTHMLEDRRGTLWLGTYGGGLLRMDPQGTVRFLTTADGLSHVAVRALCEDREGNLWVGTDGGGLNRLKPKLVKMFAVAQGLTAPVVMSVAPERRQPTALWVGLNGGGVNRIEGTEIRPLVLDPVLRTNSYVYAVVPDNRDRLWIGTYDNGIFCLEDGRLRCLRGTETWSGKPMLAGLEDKSGVLWFGGGFGLIRWRDSQLTNVSEAIGGSNVTVRALTEDRFGSVYVGTFGGGLWRHSQGQWTQFLEKDGLADNHISALYADQEDAVWVGTFNSGLSRFHRGAFRTCASGALLPGYSIVSIVADRQGNLWLGSNRGILRLAKDQIDQVVSGKCGGITPYRCDIEDGLSTLECGGGAQPAACRTPDGKLWFATVKGLAIVNPEKLPFNPLPPPVLIEEVLLNEKPLVSDGQQSGKTAPGQAASVSAPPSSGIMVPAGKHRLEFRFAALSLVAPDKVQVRYRLRGLDEDWIDAKARRSAAYSYVPPGRYQFEVVAANNDGVWNQIGASVPLVLLPPWWTSWWARTFGGLVIISIVTCWVELRSHRLRHERSLQTMFAQRLITLQEEERKHLAAELHDGLGQNLLVIKNWAQFGRRELAEVRGRERFEEISRVATECIEDVREIARNLRPYQIDRLGLTKAIEAMVASVARSSGVPCALTVESIDGLLRPGADIHFYRVVQELLSNVIKHSDATRVEINIRRASAELMLTVQDDGRGFDYAAVLGRPAHQRGLGLVDVSERVRILGGKLQCETKPTHGVRWQIDVPVQEQPESGKQTQPTGIKL